MGNICKKNKTSILFLEICKEWHPTKNGELTPDMVSCGSHKKVWWQCSQGHEWEATIGSRIKGSGCPYCSGRYAIEGETDLQTLYPELVKEWHPTKNGDLKPNKVKGGSNKKVWWQCSQGHEWESSISNRTRGAGCPYCSGQKAWIGYNDAKTFLPYLEKEWHPTKNGELTLEMLTLGSNKSVWWICEYGHEWKASIHNRAKGTGCPECSKRMQTSFPEQALYYYVSQYHKDAISRTKSILDDYKELDIYIPSLMVAIEYDGVFWHKNREKKDIDKYSDCKSKGITLIRVVEEEPIKTNCDFLVINTDLSIAISDVLKILGVNKNVNVNLDMYNIKELYYSVLRKNSLAILYPELAKEWHPTKNGNITPEMVNKGSGDTYWWRCEKGHEWKTSILHRTSGRKCPYCSGYYAIEGETDLQTLYPELAKEWHPTKNGGLMPKDFTSKSSKKVWWQCSQGHEWEAIISNRSKNGTGCPYCSGRNSIEGKTDLLSLYPDIAKEWHPTKNENITPQEVASKSNIKVWWQCSQGHEWEARVSERVRGRKCPYCSGKKVWAGYNDLETKRPDIAKEWHPTKNSGLLPNMVSCGSHKKVWWQCSQGHEWEAPIYNRVSGSGCPYCNGYYAIPGVTDLKTKYPSVAKEWHPTKNGKLTPDMVTSYSSKKVWWINDEGEEWEATVLSRTRHKKSPEF